MRCWEVAFCLCLAGLGGCFDPTGIVECTACLSYASSNSAARRGGRGQKCYVGGECNEGLVCSRGTCSSEWVFIKGGAFMMGSPEGTGGADEHPEHLVSVEGFWLMRTEVTLSRYLECVRVGKCAEPGRSGACNWTRVDSYNHPVNCVDYQDAADFCEWLGGRLPSESEWEYAALGGGHGFVYPWGNHPAYCFRAVMDDPDRGGSGCGSGGSLPVCSRPVGNSTHDLCDLAGNLSEWVRDWYHASYDDAPSDGSAREDPPGKYRVLRGGSWHDGPPRLRAARRGKRDPGGKYHDVGFRCARNALLRPG